MCLLGVNFFMSYLLFIVKYLIHILFHFQKDNVSNQREHIVLLLANEQSRLGIPEEPEPVSYDFGVLFFVLLLAF